MSKKAFHDLAYTFDSMSVLSNAINDFLDDGIFLPGGDYAGRNLLSMQEIAEMQKRRKERKETMLKEADAEKTKNETDLKGKQNVLNQNCLLYKYFHGISLDVDMIKDEMETDKQKSDKKPYDPNDPLQKAPFLFGGVINDLKRRFPHYWSDIKDGFDGQVIAAAIFIFFACLSGAIAFGGLMGAKTNNLIGISETIIVSSVSGIIFSLFAGCPLIITGVTGPVLLFDEALFAFADSLEWNGYDVLAWRVWIGIWLLVLALLVACFQGSILVKHFTKFTKDIFSSLIALLFIYEAFNKLGKIFKKHPLQVNKNTPSLSIT